MAPTVAIASSTLAPSSTTMDASDLQYLLEKLMSDQAANGGVLYLKGDGVAADAQARAGLRNPGPGFSLAGTASVVSQLASDGPALYVKFVVPTRLSSQTLQYSQAGKQYEALSPSITLDAAALAVCFPAHEARDRLMVQPSPLRPTINQG